MAAVRASCAAFAGALLLAACAGAPTAPPPAGAAPQAAAADTDLRWPLSYSLGYNVGSNLTKARAYTDLAALGQGLDDIWQRRTPRLNEQQMQQTLSTVTRRLADPALAAAPETGQPADFSYALGASIAISLQTAQDRIDPTVLQQGVAEAYAGKPAQVDTARRSELIRELHASLDQQRRPVASAGQLSAAEFLAANARREDVQVTASGLQYVVVQQGQGQRPTPGNRVSVNYTGWLTSGEVFDDAHAHGMPPASFRLANVIGGWIEGLQLMPVGSRYRFYIPPQLAYGERGAPPAIGPDQVLIFEVELVGIE